MATTAQVFKETVGGVGPDELTELPPEYKELEARVDALRAAHIGFFKTVKVFRNETYDYPTQIQESTSDFFSNFGATVTNFAALNLQGTNLPAPAPVEPKPAQHKTLPHAILRASSDAVALLSAASKDDKLTGAFNSYRIAWGKIAAARVVHDETIQSAFLGPWADTISVDVGFAMTARQAVRRSRLELDTAKQTLKAAKTTGQEAARIEVENAEDDLVQKTEVAIQLMKTVLENHAPVKNLKELTKAQYLYHKAAADALAPAQDEIDELSESE